MGPKLSVSVLDLLMGPPRQRSVGRCSKPPPGREDGAQLHQREEIGASGRPGRSYRGGHSDRSGRPTPLGSGDAADLKRRGAASSGGGRPRALLPISNGFGTSLRDGQAARKTPTSLPAGV